MNGFCCWLVQCFAEFLVAAMLEWAFSKLMERVKTSKKKRGKHFKEV